MEAAGVEPTAFFGVVRGGAVLLGYLHLSPNLAEPHHAQKWFFVSVIVSNQHGNQQLLVRLQAAASTRTLTFPAAWRWSGSAAPANITAKKVALLWL